MLDSGLQQKFCGGTPKKLDSQNERGLMSAWRAGSCILLLDGFDEIIPSRWLGAAATLKQVRWEALSSIRRLITEAPAEMGVLVAGRGHYFSSTSEMTSALGLTEAAELRLDDFDAEQATQFLTDSGSDANLPEWLPTKPLLLVQLLRAGLLGDVSKIEASAGRSDAWRQLLRLTCERESNIYSSVPPSTIQSVMQRLATAARTKGDLLAPLERTDLEQVFLEVSGRSPDEEVLQLLMRLPGLAISEDAMSQESRVFADQSLADTAYGEDLAGYLASPYQGHPLCAAATWADAADELAINVCADTLNELSISARQVLAAADNRMNHHLFDVILFDSIRAADEMGAASVKNSYIVEGVAVSELSVSAEAQVLSSTHLRDCLIDDLDLSDADSRDHCPTVERCIIERVVGVSGVPADLSSNFIDCEISTFIGTSHTTSAILNSGNPIQERVALSILHKIYAKRGRGRKDSALRRGLDTAAQSHVGSIVDSLKSLGLITSATRGNTTIFYPVRGMHQKVSSWLEHPASFDLEQLHKSDSN